MKKIVVKAQMLMLDTVLLFVKDAANKSGVEIEKTNYLLIACEEIFANICLYAYTPNEGIVVVYVYFNKKFTVCFEDTGKEFNPLEYIVDETNKPALQRKVGGLGIFIAKKYVSDMYYENEHGTNRLSISI